MGSVSPHRVGVSLALVSAALFGATTPVIAHFGVKLGPFTIAASLYLGAAVLGLSSETLAANATWAGGRPLARGDLPRIIVIALVGAALAPTLLALGLERTGPTSASLALSAEGPFTVLIATILLNEPWHRDLALGLAAMTIGGVCLALDGATTGEHAGLGVALVLSAALAWAVDNSLSRSLSSARPFRVVVVKGALGAAATTIIAIARGEPMPSLAAIVIAAAGATGYGLSLAFYLLAQRHLGAGRTGSIFAAAPFIGALFAVAAGDRALGIWAMVAAPCFAVGAWLHARERHGHPHVHEAVEHEHAHRHDDGHHHHAHDPPVTESHSHRHRHERLEHDHPHSPDIHHRHRHPRGEVS